VSVTDMKPEYRIVFFVLEVFSRPFGPKVNVSFW
jgi:hypothetical protein